MRQQQWPCLLMIICIVWLRASEGCSEDSFSIDSSGVITFSSSGVDPANCKNLTFARRGITAFSLQFSSFSNLEILDLSGNRLTSLPQGLFGSSSPPLRELSLVFNPLQSDATTIAEIRKLSTLKSLNLVNTFATQLPDDFFVDLPLIEEFQAYATILTTVPSSLFALNELKHLGISVTNEMSFHNSARLPTFATQKLETAFITSGSAFLPVDWFNSLRGQPLRKIELWFPFLEYLHSDALSGLGDFDDIELIGNFVKRLPGDLLDRIGSSSSLTLGVAIGEVHECLPSVPSAKFSQVRARSLDIDYYWNHSPLAGEFTGGNSTDIDWQSLQQSVQTQCSNIISNMKLEHTDIRTLPTGAFSGYSDLTELTLINNSLSNIPTDIGLGSLTSLNHLTIAHNLISSLPSGFFGTTPPPLESLNLMFNPLQTDDTTIGEIRKLSTLKDLVLVNIYSVELPDNFFEDLPLLRTFQSYASIMSKVPSSLFSLSNLEEIGLSVWNETAFHDVHRLPSFGSEFLRNIFLTTDSTLLTADWFESLRQFRSVSLWMRRLEYLPSGSLDGLGNIEELAIGGLCATKLPGNIFQHVESISSLSLLPPVGEKFLCSPLIHSTIGQVSASAVDFDYYWTHPPTGGEFTGGRTVELDWPTIQETLPLCENTQITATVIRPGVTIGLTSYLESASQSILTFVSSFEPTAAQLQFDVNQNFPDGLTFSMQEVAHDAANFEASLFDASSTISDILKIAFSTDLAESVVKVVIYPVHLPSTRRLLQERRFQIKLDSAIDTVSCPCQSVVDHNTPLSCDVGLGGSFAIVQASDADCASANEEEELEQVIQDSETSAEVSTAVIASVLVTSLVTTAVTTTGVAVTTATSASTSAAVLSTTSTSAASGATMSTGTSGTSGSGSAMTLISHVQFLAFVGRIGGDVEEDDVSFPEGIKKMSTSFNWMNFHWFDGFNKDESCIPQEESKFELGVTVSTLFAVLVTVSILRIVFNATVPLVLGRMGKRLQKGHVLFHFPAWEVKMIETQQLGFCEAIALALISGCSTYLISGILCCVVVVTFLGAMLFSLHRAEKSGFVEYAPKENGFWQQISTEREAKRTELATKGESTTGIVTRCQIETAAISAAMNRGEWGSKQSLTKVFFLRDPHGNFIQRYGLLFDAFTSTGKHFGIWIMTRSCAAALSATAIKNTFANTLVVLLIFSMDLVLTLMRPWINRKDNFMGIWASSCRVATVLLLFLYLNDWSGMTELQITKAHLIVSLISLGPLVLLSLPVVNLTNALSSLCCPAVSKKLENSDLKVFVASDGQPVESDAPLPMPI